MDKGGIQRVVWKRPVTGRTAPLCRSTATEKIPFLAVSRALGMLYAVNDRDCSRTVVQFSDCTLMECRVFDSFDCCKL